MEQCCHLGVNPDLLPLAHKPILTMLFSEFMSWILIFHTLKELQEYVTKITIYSKLLLITVN